MDASPDNRSRAIAVNLAALHNELTLALAQVTEACEFADRGDQNCAIGTILSVGALLDDAQAHFRGAIALHRMNLRIPVLRPAVPVESTREETSFLRTARARFRFFSRFLRRD